MSEKLCSIKKVGGGTQFPPKGKILNTAYGGASIKDIPTTNTGTIRLAGGGFIANCADVSVLYHSNTGTVPHLVYCDKDGNITDAGTITNGMTIDKTKEKVMAFTTAQNTNPDSIWFGR